MPTLAACVSALLGHPDPKLHSQAPASSCFISSFSGMSWMAALIFSRMASTWLCHFRLQCLLSTSQSARQAGGKQGVSWEKGLTLPPPRLPYGARWRKTSSPCVPSPPSRWAKRWDKIPVPSPGLGRAGGERVRGSPRCCLGWGNPPRHRGGWCWGHALPHSGVTNPPGEGQE